MTSQNVIIDIEKNNTPSKETVINCESSQEKFKIEVRSEITTEDICPVCLEKFKDLHKVYEFLPCHHYCCENCTKHIKLIRRIDFLYLDCPICRQVVKKLVSKYFLVAPVY